MSENMYDAWDNGDRHEIRQQFARREEIAKLFEKANGWSPAAYLNTMEDLERFAALVAAAEREAILPMLKGIDSTQTEDKDGWWETSAGADYGAGILAAIRARGEKT